MQKASYIEYQDRQMDEQQKQNILQISVDHIDNLNN